MPGHGELLAATHAGRFDEDDVAAHRRPDEPDGNAGPLDTLLDFLLRAEFRHAEEFADHFRCRDHLFHLAFRDAPRLLPRNGGDLAFQVAHAGFAREAVNDFAQPFVGEVDLLADVQAVLFGLLWDQVLVSDVQLLFSRVAWQFDDLHAVPQRFRDGIHPVRRGNEDNLGEIERHIEIVIAEGVVLLRVENLHQRRGRIAAEIAPELVDFVQHHDRVVRFTALQSLNNLSGQRADTGAPVAADFGFVVHAAKSDAHELASKRTRARFADRGLAHAPMPDEAPSQSRHA